MQFHILLYFRFDYPSPNALSTPPLAMGKGMQRLTPMKPGKVNSSLPALEHGLIRPIVRRPSAERRLGAPSDHARLPDAVKHSHKYSPEESFRRDSLA